MTDDLTEIPEARTSFTLDYSPPNEEDLIAALNALSGVYPVLRYFGWQHLPAQLRGISRAFAELALEAGLRRPNGHPETTMSLRKLLESKDAAVRADLPDPKNEKTGPQPATRTPTPGRPPEGIRWEPHVAADGVNGVIRPFTHPDYSGEGIHPTCGRAWEGHGIIDLGFNVITLCPGALLTMEHNTPNLAGIHQGAGLAP